MKTENLIFSLAEEWASVGYDITAEPTDEKEICFLFCDYLIRKGIMTKGEFDIKGKKVFNMMLRRNSCQE